MNATAARSERALLQSKPPSTSAGSLLDFALLYASLGFRVFPCYSIRDDGKCSCGKPDCSAAGKHPHYDRETLPNGVKNATTDEGTIRKWWTQWPDANIAVAGGNGLGILDIDPARGGNESFAALESELGELPATWRVKTGGGGEHCYFAVPAGVRIGNATDLRPGIDIRGENGYVIAPPSGHASGGIYKWASPLQLPGPQPASSAWIAELSARPIAVSPSLYISILSRDGDSQPWPVDAQKRVNAAVKRLRVRQPGTRNKRMMELVRSLANIPELRGSSGEDFLPAIWQWFDLSKDCMEMEWAAVEKHWLYLWGQWVDHAFQDATYQAHAAAREKPLPDAAKRYGDDATQRLAALCCELERRSGAKNWYLSCRKAQDVLGISRRQAHEGLKRLEADGVIEKTAPHARGSLKAQRFRYIAETAAVKIPLRPGTPLPMSLAAA